MKFSRYCSCGGAMKGEITPSSKAEVAIKIWNSIHCGEGHKPVDSKTSSYARRKQEIKKL